MPSDFAESDGMACQEPRLLEHMPSHMFGHVPGQATTGTLARHSAGVLGRFHRLCATMTLHAVRIIQLFVAVKEQIWGIAGRHESNRATL